MIVLGGAVVGGVVLRAGMTRAWVEGVAAASAGRTPRSIELRVWDWWSPATNEEYGAYFGELERMFEEQNPDVDLVYQTVPFGNYVQKLATAMVGQTPPDVFQSSVYWAEGFHHRGMLRPLNDLLEADDGEGPTCVDATAFLPSAWGHNHTADDVVFGIPQIIDANCLVWNLDILQEAAGDDPEIRDMFVRLPEGTVDYDHIRFDAVRDWDHFRRVVKKLTVYGPDEHDEDDDQYGFLIYGHGGGGGMFSPWLAANGGHYQDAAGTRALFASPNGVQAMELMANLYWNDRVCPGFKRQLLGAEQFQEGKLAVTLAGTWSGKDIMRNTGGKFRHFGKTAFPPGPMGNGQKTVCWGNMLVISRRCRNVEAAWRYMKFVCGLEGNLLRSRHLGYNGPRLDFYETQRWRDAVAQRPYLSNVKQICLVGEKLRHTEIIASDHQANAVFETILLHYPDIVSGEGSYTSVRAALELAARDVDRVYERYNRQVQGWLRRRSEAEGAP